MHTIGKESQNFRIYPYSNDHLFLAGFFWRDIRPSPHVDRHEQPLTLIKSYKTWLCYDPHDKIYALLGLATDCKDGSGLRPDHSKTKAVVLWDVIEFCKPPIGQLTDVAGMLQSSLDVSSEEILASSSMLRQHEPNLSLKLGGKQFSTLQRGAVGIIVQIEVCSFDVGEASPKILKHPHLAFIADIFSPDAEDSEEDSNNDDSGPHNATTQEPRPAPADIVVKALYHFRFMINIIRLATPVGAATFFCSC